MPFKAHYLSPEGHLQQDLSEGEVRAAFESKEGCCGWTSARPRRKTANS